MAGQILIRPFRNGDEISMAALVAHTLRVSNAKDYSSEYIQATIDSHAAGFFAERSKDAHFYVACDGENISVSGHQAKGKITFTRIPGEQE